MGDVGPRVAGHRGRRPAGHRRRHRSIGALLIVVLAAPVAVIAQAEEPIGPHVVDPEIHAEARHTPLTNSAQATASGVRVDPPERPPFYWPGRCDTFVPGMPQLNAYMAPPEARVIGASVQGRAIIAEYWGPAEPTAVVLVVGQIHGNECSPLLLIDRIRQHPPEDHGIWLIPALNPDGHAAYDRENANGADLNADGGYFRQPESRALRDFVAQIRPDLTVHLHSPNGFLGAYPSSAATARQVCGAVGDATALRCAGGGAGSRADRKRWFLWQGLREFGGDTLLVELFAVHDSEVPWAQPRPPTRTVEQVRADVVVIMNAIDAAL